MILAFLLQNVLKESNNPLLMQNLKIISHHLNKIKNVSQFSSIESIS